MGNFVPLSIEEQNIVLHERLSENSQFGLWVPVENDVTFFLVNKRYYDNMLKVIRLSRKLRNLEPNVKNIIENLPNSYTDEDVNNDVKLASNFQKIYRLAELKRQLEYSLANCYSLNRNTNIYPVNKLGAVNCIEISASNILNHDKSSQKMHVLVAGGRVIQHEQIKNVEEVALENGLLQHSHSTYMEQSYGYVSTHGGLNNTQQNFVLVAYNRNNGLPDFEQELFGEPVVQQLDFNQIYKGGYIPQSISEYNI